MDESLATADLVKRRLRQLADPTRAANSAWFFKTGKGEYGEGDKFLGITVPVQRKTAHRFKNLPLKEIARLLKSPFHECRFTALEILVVQFETALKKSGQNSGPDFDTGKIYMENCEKIADFYLTNTKYINNWDLVDTSASYILGAYLYEFRKSRAILYKLAKSKNLWERRIAVVSTFYFVARNDLDDSFKIAEMLLSDGEDLIHKAVGWMLREVGKRDKKVLVGFLERYAGRMPRTMLRYSLEKFGQMERRKYLNMFSSVKN